jgi:hypothetical protein
MFYVVLSGVRPGIYTTMPEVLDNICNVPGADVRAVASQEDATLILHAALRSDGVHGIFPRSPYADFQIPPQVSRARPSLKPSKIATTKLGVKGPVKSLTLEELHDGPYQYYHVPRGGPDTVKWIVIKGRRPGIYGSW